MRTTVRTSETAPENAFTEVTTGDSPSSVEMSQNARGAWQPTIKLYFATPDEAREKAAEMAAAIRDSLAQSFTLAG